VANLSVRYIERQIETMEQHGEIQVRNLEEKIVEIHKKAKDEATINL